MNQYKQTKYSLVIPYKNEQVSKQTVELLNQDTPFSDNLVLLISISISAPSNDVRLSALLSLDISISNELACICDLYGRPL